MLRSSMNKEPSMYDSEQFGMITIHNEVSPLGKVATTYVWKGPSKFRARVHGEPDIFFDALDANKKDGRFTIGPYRVIVLDVEPAYGYVDVIRQDDPFWLLVYWAHRSSRALRIIEGRIILTLAVWNLAEHHSFTVPAWSDVYLVKWLTKLIRK